MRLLVTGGTGVLGRAFRPLAAAAGHDLQTPTPAELDLFDPVAVANATRGVDAVLHLATRIQPLERLANAEAWRENDRLRGEAARILVDAALTAAVAGYVQPTVTFVYPTDGPVSEDTPLADVPAILRSALDAEQEAGRFARAGRRGGRSPLRPARRPRYGARRPGSNARRHPPRRRHRPGAPLSAHPPQRDLQRLP